MKWEEEIRKILERRLEETSYGGKRENIERWLELSEIRQELLGDKLTIDGWVNSGEKSRRKSE